MGATMLMVGLGIRAVSATMIGESLANIVSAMFLIASSTFCFSLAWDLSSAALALFSAGVSDFGGDCSSI